MNKKNKYIALMITLFVLSFTLVHADESACDPGATYLYESDFANGPYQITTPGIYCLVEDVVTNADPAFLVDTGFNLAKTTIDLNGYTLQTEDRVDPELGPIAASSRAFSMSHTLAGQQPLTYTTNVEIKDGKVLGFTTRNVDFSYVRDVTVSNVVFEYDDAHGVYVDKSIRATVQESEFIANNVMLGPFQGVGVYLSQAQDAVVQGSSFNGLYYAMNITSSDEVLVKDNDVTDMTFGLAAAAVDNLVFEENRLSGDASSPWGVLLLGNNNAEIVSNEFDTMKSGVDMWFSDVLAFRNSMINTDSGLDVWRNSILNYGENTICANTHVLVDSTSTANDLGGNTLLPYNC